MFRISVKILSIAMVLLLGFTNCEGRKTQHQALSEDIEEYNKTVNIEIDVFIPEIYMEREVDTVLHNGYRVKIKTYIDMENSVLYTKIKDTINYQTHYRNYKFDILVEKDGKEIFNRSFNKQKTNEALGFKSNLVRESELNGFDKLSILKSIQVDDDPTNTNTVVIDIIYGIPETERISYHKLMINEEGHANFILTDKH